MNDMNLGEIFHILSHNAKESSNKVMNIMANGDLKSIETQQKLLYEMSIYRIFNESQSTLVQTYRNLALGIVNKMSS